VVIFTTPTTEAIANATNAKASHPTTAFRRCAALQRAARDVRFMKGGLDIVLTFLPVASGLPCRRPVVPTSGGHPDPSKIRVRDQGGAPMSSAARSGKLGRMASTTGRGEHHDDAEHRHAGSRPTRREAEDVDRYAGIKQYSLGQIFAVWAAAALPMGILAWIVAPAIEDSFSGSGHVPLIKALLLLLTGGMIWQFVLVMGLVWLERRSLR
jgi:hypothetical protein